MKGDKTPFLKCPQNNITVRPQKKEKKKKQTLSQLSLPLAVQMKCGSNLVYWHLFFIFHTFMSSKKPWLMILLFYF